MEKNSIYVKKLFLEEIEELIVGSNISIVKKELMEDIKRKISIFNYKNISNGFILNHFFINKGNFCNLLTYDIRFNFINSLKFGWSYYHGYDYTTLKGWTIIIKIDEDLNVLLNNLFDLSIPYYIKKNIYNFLMKDIFPMIINKIK